ncbi:MAG: glycosyltransferase family 2 protein [Akkermansia sp.]|nr:glycosyltransferase family 2 protein [Akkermansia sp.]
MKEHSHCKISLIVPVYNAERYFADCLESVLAQTYQDYEVVIVNDGSTDGSAVIAEKYARRDSRFSVYHQQNAGVTAARRNAIANAAGDYVFFLDADDTLPQNALEIFSQYINREWDIIIAQWQDLTAVRKKESLSIEEYRRRLIFSKIQVGACGKLVKRTLFTKSVLALPREIKVGEDWIMHLRLSFNTENNVLVIPNQVYCYNLNEGSVTSTFKHNIEYARKFYPHLVESVPASYAGKYVPLVTNAIIARWLVYTADMFRLSETAGKFHNELKTNYCGGFAGLDIISRLLFLNAKTILRLPLLGGYRVWRNMLPILKKLVYSCRLQKNKILRSKCR